MRVIVPSAKIVGEDLQKLGKLPSVIYPVNKGIVFDYIFDQFKDICSNIDIICYENAEKVHRRLSNCDPERVRIIDLPEINDLGHTIHFALSDKSEAIVINFGDTIVMENATQFVTDSFFYASDFYSEMWTFFEIENGIIERVIDKSSVEHRESDKGKLFVGVFVLADSLLFKNCLEEAFKTQDSSMGTFYKALQSYSRNRPLQAIPTSNWFDIGHEEKYYNSALEVKAREFNHITIDKDRGILRKTSKNVDKFIGEIKWYLKLPSDVEYARPRIFDYSLAYTDPYVSMEYYAYHTLHELFLYGDLTKKQWSDVFSKIAFVCSDFRRYSVRDKDIPHALKDIYLKKTLQRLSQMRSDKRFDNFFTRDINVNGARYLSLNKIAEKLQEAIPQMLYDVNQFNIIHGDLCFANIMVDNNFSFIKVIDPRGKFGKFDIYGDPRYELAKLFHSVDGKYDFIIKDLFKVSYDLETSRIEFTISDRARDYDLYQVFRQSFKDEIADDLKKIELIEALLFLSMIPLHEESFNHQMVMLGTGIEILNRVIDITKGNEYV